MIDYILEAITERLRWLLPALCIALLAWVVLTIGLVVYALV